jgi:gas vesicle protein
MNRNLKKILTAAQIAAGTGLYLLDHSDETKRKVRQLLGDQMDDLRDRAKDTYAAAADRAADLSKVFRGDESNGTGRNALRFMVGLGVGIGVALLMAPASGEDTRARLTEKAQEFGDRARQRFGARDLRVAATGD